MLTLSRQGTPLDWAVEKANDRKGHAYGPEDAGRFEYCATKESAERLAAVLTGRGQLVVGVVYRPGYATTL